MSYQYAFQIFGDFRSKACCLVVEFRQLTLNRPQPLNKILVV